MDLTDIQHRWTASTGKRADDLGPLLGLHFTSWYRYRRGVATPPATLIARVQREGVVTPTEAADLMRRYHPDLAEMVAA